MTKNTYTIDATGKTLGRVASAAAKMLIGKGEADFERHLLPEVKVTVTNAGKMKIMQKKMQQTVYDWYTGYPGGRREETMAGLAKRKGFAAILEKTIEGMLPKNKLKAAIMKQLTVTE